jgi:glycosyltransferase involved in cell wall biosynthesis
MRKQIRPLVSVIIPVFNGSFYVEETVASVQKSTFKNFEILLVDDGSTDKSKKVCHTLEKKYKKVRFYSFPKNKGLGRVLNFALGKARGKYICRINQDDRMLKNRMRTQVNFLEKNPGVVALGSYIKMFRNKSKKYEVIKFLSTDDQIKKVWYIVGPFADPSVMYRKQVALKAGGYVQAMWPADDTHLWYRMGQKGQLANIQKPLVEVRWHKDAASFKYFHKLALSTYKMHLWTNKNIKRAPLPVHLFWLGQLGCGLLLPAEFNWTAYRLIKKGIEKGQRLNFLGRNFLKKIKIVVKVASQPIVASFSGQYKR